MEKSTQSQTCSEHVIKTGTNNIDTNNIQMEGDLCLGERIRPSSVHRSLSMKQTHL
jgi:hypothetical protein